VQPQPLVEKPIFFKPEPVKPVRAPVPPPPAPARTQKILTVPTQPVVPITDRRSQLPPAQPQSMQQPITKIKPIQPTPPAELPVYRSPISVPRGDTQKIPEVLVPPAVPIPNDQQKPMPATPQPQQSQPLVEKPLAKTESVQPEPLTAPSEPDLSVGAVIGAVKGGIPAATKKQLQTLVLKNAKTTKTFTKELKKFVVDADVDFLGIPMKAQFQISKKGDLAPGVGTARDELDQQALDDATALILRLEIPQDVDLGTLFPDLQGRLNFKFSRAALILCNKEYADEGFDDYPVEEGLTLLAEVSLDQKQQTSLGVVGDFLMKLVDKVYVGVAIRSNIAESSLKIHVPIAPDKQYKLTDLMPLQDLPMPDSVKTSLSNIFLQAPAVTAEIGKDTQKIDLNGAITIFGAQATLFLTAGRGFNVVEDDDETIVQTGLLTAAKIEMPDRWNFAQSLPELAALDQFLLPGMVIVLSNYTYDDDDYRTRIQRGLNVISRLKMGGSLAAVGGLAANLAQQSKYQSKVKSTDFILAGALASDIRKSFFKTVIPINVTFDFMDDFKRGIIKNRPTTIEKLSIDALTISVAASGNVTVGSEVTITPVDKAAPLTFQTAVDVGPNKAAFRGAMDGTWNDAFGIKWFDIEDPAIELELEYALLAVGLPSGFGLRAKFIVGENPDVTLIDIAGKVAIKTDGIGDFVLSGKVNKIDLRRLLALLNQMLSEPLPSANLPPILFEKVELTVVPKSAFIAGQFYEQQVTAACEEMNIAGLRGRLNFTMSKRGLVGEGVLRNFEAPGIKISGPGSDKRKGTGDDGAIISAEISVRKQEFLIAGLVTIFPFSIVDREILARLDGSGITFGLTESLFNRFQTDLLFKIGFNADSITQAFVRAAFTQTGLREFEQLLHTESEKFVAESTVKLREAQAEVLKIDRQIEHKVQEIKNEHEASRAAIAHVKHSIVAGAQKEADKTVAKIVELEATVAGFAKDCYQAPLQGACVELAANKTYLQGFLKPGSATIADVVQASKIVVPSDATIMFDPRVVPLTVARDVALKALEFAQGQVESLGKFGHGVAQVVGQGLNIEEFKFEGDMQEFFEGKMPHVTLKGIFLGKPFAFENITFDFTKPAESCAQLFKILSGG